MAYGDNFAAKIENISTRRTYQVALNAFRRFLLEKCSLKDIDVNDITTSMINEFVVYQDQTSKSYFSKKEKAVVTTKKKKKKGTAAKSYVGKLSAIFSKAKEQFNDEDNGVVLIPRSPFSRVKIDASPSVGQRPLTLEQMRIIVNAKASDEFERAALDIFIVSFGMMGANLVDLFWATPPVDGVWHYFRKKTESRRQDRAEMYVKVPACLGPYLERLKRYAREGRWLNLSWRYSGMPSANKSINVLLDKWAKKNGIPPFRMYSVRKSWATIARSHDVAIDKATVDECLAHVGNLRVADIYISRDWELLWQANQRVCDYVFNNLQDK